MKFNPEIHHRRSIRLKGYNYSQNGVYFVTMCVQNRECLLGKVVDNKMVLNDAGTMIRSVFEEIPQFYPGAGIDIFQIMPNHVHAIIYVGADPCACSSGKGQPRGVAPTLSLPDIIHRFKILTTKRYMDHAIQKNWQPFLKKLWQRNYYEHIIRDKGEYDLIGEYIKNNPFNSTPTYN
ncbi:MAG: transposase [Acidobacteria bacterium]|nr:transposase [Acidobacteriota bacterium]MBU4307657.1 transposase [Acidobacteriota bacterium]